MNIYLIVIIVLVVILICSLISSIVKYTKTRQILDDYESYKDSAEFLNSILFSKCTYEEFCEICLKVRQINELDDDDDDENEINGEAEVTYYESK